MIPLLAIAAAALVGIVIITFWDEIKKYLGLAIKKVKKIIPAAIVGFATFLQTLDLAESFKAAYKFYSKDKNNKWHETTVTKEISESEVPEEIRLRAENANGRAIDITEELALELQ